MNTTELEQITQWHDADEHQKIIAFLTERDFKLLTTEDKSILARAYNNVDEYGKAIELLLSIADECQEDALWHFRMGYALYYRGDSEHLDAAYYFTKAYELDSEDLAARSMMLEANKLEPMTERVKKFWAWFAENEDTLLEIVSGASRFNREDIVDFINEGTDLISKNVYFNLGGNNEFTFCVEGKPYLFYLYPYIVEQAPKELKERWQFFTQKPELRGANFDFEMYNLKISVPEIKVKTHYKEKEEQFAVDFYIPNAEALDEDLRNHFFYTILELVVGEGLSYNYISGIQSVAEDREMIPLSELGNHIRSELEARELNLYYNPAELYTVYEPKPQSEEEDYVPRHDIFLGNTCCMPNIIDYYNDRDYMYCGFNSFGAESAYLSFLLPEGLESQTALTIRNSLEDSIEEFLTERKLGRTLGAAIANGVLYVDVLLYNFREFLIQGFAAEELTRENIFPKGLDNQEALQPILDEMSIFFCSFYRDAPVAKLYPDDKEDEDEESDEADDEDVVPLYAYDEDERNCVEEHISKTFGQVDNVFHELVSPDVHLDIMITEPTSERNYYTLTTCGMGAYQMDVPSELKDDGLDRAEVCICLPPDWDIHNEDESFYWAIRLLKILGRLPVTNETWLGWGHSIGGSQKGDDTLAPNVGFTGALLVNPSGIEEGANVCELPNGERVNFYQVIPLYPQEIAYKCEHRAEGLLDQMQGVSHIVDIKRRNVCYYPTSQKKRDKEPF